MGNTIIKVKKVEKLMMGELVDYRCLINTKGKTEHILQTDSKIKRHGSEFTEALVVSLSTSGENKDSWRIAVSFGRI